MYCSKDVRHLLGSLLTLSFSGIPRTSRKLAGLFPVLFMRPQVSIECITGYSNDCLRPLADAPHPAPILFNAFTMAEESKRLLSRGKMDTVPIWILCALHVLLGLQPWNHPKLITCPPTCRLSLHRYLTRFLMSQANTMRHTLWHMVFHRSLSQDSTVV